VQYTARTNSREFRSRAKGPQQRQEVVREDCPIEEVP
jgi:hypothetical protein